MFLYTMGEDTAPKPDPDTKALLKGDPFAGLGSYQSSMYFEWWRPQQVGDRLYSRRALVGVQDKKSDFGGRTGHEYISWVYFNQRSEEHTSELQSRENLVCRLLLEKKK